MIPTNKKLMWLHFRQLLGKIPTSGHTGCNYVLIEIIDSFLRSWVPYHQPIGNWQFRLVIEKRNIGLIARVTNEGLFS